VKRKYVLLALAALVLVGAVVVQSQLPKLTVDLPVYERPAQLVRLEQNWTAEQRKTFHYTAQGTRLIPYDWFMALEQPCFNPSGCGMFADAAYLSRFGFIPGETDPQLNPNGLPVGFAIDRTFVDPGTKQKYPVVGLQCAACHTGEFYYGNYVVQVEGAPGTIEVAAFQKALGLALAFNVKFPFSVGRYSRFESRLLGPSPTDAQRADLKERLTQFLAPLLHEAEVAVTKHLYDNDAGFRRTDALTRIGNAVFATYMQVDANYAVANAPVRYPQIWDASWFSWIQYNASIADPLVRNIGEALGVRAQAKLYGPDAGKFENSINMNGLRELEATLAGPAPLEGLRSPQWPSVLPPLDTQKVAEGEALYTQYCRGCHLPPIKEIVAQRPASPTAPGNKYWVNSVGTWLIKVTDIPLEEIGTDPHEAEDYAKRTADTGALGLGRKTAREGLMLVTRTIANNFFEANNIPVADRVTKWRSLDPGQTADPMGYTLVRDAIIYKARPLNGVWTLGTYLHNGSVPNLYLLLSPQSDRPATFYVGSKRFDPVNVGFETTKMKGATLFDTSLPGNSNIGHEFRTAPPNTRGVIGPLLTHQQRMALIEYLKSL
jgi:mono/diheme cytochrome c family protein